MNHDAEEGFPLGLREIVSKNCQPGVLGPFSVGID